MNVKCLFFTAVSVSLFCPAAYGQYCSASGGCAGIFPGQEYINGVQVGDIDYVGIGCSGYADYTSVSTIMKIGTSYGMTVVNGCGWLCEGTCGIWVDWNQDGDFYDTDEEITVGGGPETFTATITPPAGAELGDTRMRIRISRDSGTCEPCGDTEYGEVEDYTITVTEPGYCSASGGCGEYISDVQVGDINNTGTGCSGYADYTSMSTTMETGTGYGITVVNGDGWLYEETCGIWVDWNQDEDFYDTGEEITVGGGPKIFTATITPPALAEPGETRMRIRIRYSGTCEPCGDTDHGEVEDYTITVKIGPKYGGGNGTKQDPYLIYTAEQMNTIGIFPSDWGKHFKLMADIDLGAYTGTSFNIIGPHFENAFMGVFDGDGHVISNFTYDCDGIDYIGLFGYIDDPNAEVKNLGLIDPNVVASGNFVGSLVGHIKSGAVSGCYVEGGSVAGHLCVGGMAGFFSEGEIQGCNSAVSVTGTDNVGGLVGQSLGAITECYSTANVSGEYRVGGLVGYNLEIISRCNSRGIVSGIENVGGLAGVNYEGLILQCYSTSSVSGDIYVGGLLGLNNTYQSGRKALVSNCYWRGSIVGYNYVAGLVAENLCSAISYCYSAGHVDADVVKAGLVATTGGCLSSTCTSSFWDKDTSGISWSKQGTGKTTEEMMTEDTFTNAGWDFVGEVVNGPNDIWDICEGMNYPKLTWQVPVVGDFVCPDGVEMSDLWVLCDEWLLGELSCDFRPDGFVDFLDWVIFADDWGVSYSMSDLKEFTKQWLKRGATAADVAPDTGDGIVNMTDFSVMADSWLEGI